MKKVTISPLSAALLGMVSLPLTFVIGYRVMTGRFGVENLEVKIIAAILGWPFMWRALIGIYRALLQKIIEGPKSGGSGASVFLVFLIGLSVVALMAMAVQTEYSCLITLSLTILWTVGTYLLLSYIYRA